MKRSFITLIMCFAACCEVIQAFSAEVTVFGTGGSTAPLVVETVPEDPLEYPFKWSFNSPESGWTKRTVVRVEASTNETFAAFLDKDGNGAYTPGEPFGVSSGRTPPSIELTDTCAITPRVNLWEGNAEVASDRGVIWGSGSVVAIPTNMTTSAKGSSTIVNVSRLYIDGKTIDRVGLYGLHNTVLQRTFNQEVRSFLHEGDFLQDGAFDIDSDYFFDEVANNRSVWQAGCYVTNVTYIITFNSSTSPTNGLSTLINRRFEETRTIPTPIGATNDGYKVTFAFRIDGEDTWASKFGTSYTAFKVKILTVVGTTTNEVWNTGIVRLPPVDEKGVYRYTATLPSSIFSNLSSLITHPSSLYYKIALYNAKFSTDDCYSIGRKDEKKVFSTPVVFSPEPPQEDPSGVVELKVSLGRFYRIQSDVIIVDAETFAQISRIPAPTIQIPSRVRVSKFKTSDTNAVFAAFLDKDGNGAYTPGEPFGVSSGRKPPSIELTDTCAITPRVNLWEGNAEVASDRGVIWGSGSVVALPTNMTTVAHGSMTDAKVTRYLIDGFSIGRVGINGKSNTVFRSKFDKNVRSFLHEGDFIEDGALDIDWANLNTEVVDWPGVSSAGCQVTNVTYVITFNSSTSPTNGLSTLINRRFEKTRTIPTPIGATNEGAKVTFAFRIDGEDPYAAMFGTTYTAMKAKIVTVVGTTTNDVWDTGTVRLPPADRKGVYRYTATLPSSIITHPSSLLYKIALYNAKFSDDTILELGKIGNPFCAPQPIQ